VTNFNFSSGDPSHLVGGSLASMADIQGPLVDIRTFLNGSITDVNLASTAAITEAKLATGSAGLARGVFHAYRNAAQSIPAGTGVVTVVTFNAEVFDVSGWHDTTTGRYTPQVAGIYRLSWLVTASGALTADTQWQAIVRKNGTAQVNAEPSAQRGTTFAVASGGTGVVEANGTTDFFEVGVWHTLAAAQNTSATFQSTFFMGEFIGRS
jgi:hypothetical protein